MKTVMFVDSLNIKQLPVMGDHVEYYVWDEESLRPGMTDDECYFDAATRKIAPINRICAGHGNDVYVAYSGEVEAYLGLPFRVMREHIEDLEKRNLRLEGEYEIVASFNAELKDELLQLYNMSLWERIKFVFAQAGG